MRTATKRAKIFLDTLYQDLWIAPGTGLPVTQTIVELMDDKNYVVIADIFDNADMARVTPANAMSMLQTTSTARYSLYMNSWWRFLARAKSACAKHGLNAEDIFHGLPKWNEA